MKRYFLIRTADDERNASYKKICSTYEEAVKEVPKYADWWSSYGTCSIHEVDENFLIYKVYKFANGSQISVVVWKEG